jgi:glycerol-3-phosphate acyltransferase PlsX
MTKLFRQQFLQWWPSLIGLFLQLPALRSVKAKIDYTEYGGAPLLGVNGVVIITHGRAKSKTIKNSLKAAAVAVKQNLIDAIAQIKKVELPVG